MLPQHLLYQQRRVFGQNITNTLPRAKTPPPFTASPLTPPSHHHVQCKEVVIGKDNMNKIDCRVNAHCNYQPQVNKLNNALHTFQLQKIQLQQGQQQCKRVKRDPYAERQKKNHTPHHLRRTLSVPPTIMFTPNESVYLTSMKLHQTNPCDNQWQGQQTPLFTQHKSNHNNIFGFRPQRTAQLLQRKQLQPPLFPPIFANQKRKFVKINNSDDKDEQNSSSSSLTFSDLDDVSPINIFDETAMKVSNTVHNLHSSAHINDKQMDNNYCYNRYNALQPVTYNDIDTTAQVEFNANNQYALFTPEIVAIMTEKTNMLK